MKRGKFQAIGDLKKGEQNEEGKRPREKRNDGVQPGKAATHSNFL
jgi:hypothetical protein